MKSKNVDFTPRKILRLYYHFGVYTKSGIYPRNFALELFNVVKILDDAQHQYTSDALYDFLGYME